MTPLQTKAVYSLVNTWNLVSDPILSFNIRGPLYDGADVIAIVENKNGVRIFRIYSDGLCGCEEIISI